MSKLAEKIINITQSSSKVLINNHTLPDVRIRRPNITLARQELSYNPQVQLESGIKMVVQCTAGII